MQFGEGGSDKSLCETERHFLVKVNKSDIILFTLPDCISKEDPDKFYSSAQIYSNQVHYYLSQKTFKHVSQTRDSATNIPTSMPAT